MAGTTSARPFAILGGERFDQASSPIFRAQRLQRIRSSRRVVIVGASRT